MGRRVPLPWTWNLSPEPISSRSSARGTVPLQTTPPPHPAVPDGGMNPLGTMPSLESEP